MDYTDVIKEHYQSHWGEFTEYTFSAEPICKLLPQFCILKFYPNEKRNSYTYATCGMSANDKEQGLELFILAPDENDFLIEMLATAAHYHASGNTLDLGHTVNFGCPWYDGSECDHGLISLPYLDGPSLEWLHNDTADIRFLWLIPITKEEREYKKGNGTEALESLFEKNSFNYTDPFRKSVV